jgi:hypothetical protein
MIDTGKYIYFNKSNRLKKSFFFKSFGINPRSYIGQIISRIHDYYFINSISLKKDYKKHYKKEYNSFREYLNKRHNLFQNEINILKYNVAYFSEKHIAEQYKVDGLLDNEYDDNIIREKFISIVDTNNE